ncbi:carbohydrate ABC transporter permease [Actinomadura bangladeshensis]|uniref:Sugar ABC transporter permease n=1 Tax=Actinomadura bangladeshensis TaxID=453573 RepID=A0A6L9QQV5_9ACTN|nr:sugar ABC transporter permease [Actinomadura bangladeshensis]NEA26344.1 sugar ABC transporter permease [Actinomadura bangladeshensis]
MLLVPAAFFTLTSLVVPTVQTILRGFQRGGLPKANGGDLLPRGRFVGVDNYADLFGLGEFWKALAFTVSLAVIPLVVAVVVAPLLAAALDRAGTWPRRAGRVLMSVPLVVFSPVAFSVAWLLGMPDGGLETAFGELSAPGSARAAVVAISGLTTFGAVCGLALLGYLAVLRDRGPARRVRPALAVGTIAALATFAVSLQTFSSVYTMTRGGPGRSTQTLSLFQFSVSFVSLSLGHGAAVATVTGLILGVLGIAATLVAITTALRIDLVPAEPTAKHGPGGRPAGPVRIAVAAAALLAVLAVVLVGAWPWLSALFSSPGPRGAASPADARTYVNTWVPPLLGAVVSVGAAFLGALGIGGLRPLGRRSEWLLLPFAPWLFVGIGPLSIAGFENVGTLDLINSFGALIPPMLISVPALVVLTLFCRGRAAVWQGRVAAGAPAAGGFLRVVAVPALPLAVLLGGATVLINAQDLLWPLLVATDDDNMTAPVVLVSELNQYSGPDVSLGFVTPLAVLVLALLVLAALQVTYLDRLAITVDRPTGAPAPAQNVPLPRPGAPFAPWPAPAPPPAPAPHPEADRPPD